MCCLNTAFLQIEFLEPLFINIIICAMSKEAFGFMCVRKFEFGNCNKKKKKNLIFSTEHSILLNARNHEQTRHYLFIRYYRPRFEQRFYYGNIIVIINILYTCIVQHTHYEYLLSYHT